MGATGPIKKLLKYDLLRGRKRCPFCHQDGREAETRRRRCGKGEFNKIRYYVECWHCLARGPLCDSKKEADKGWEGEFPKSRSTRLQDMVEQSMQARDAEIEAYSFVKLSYRFCTITEKHPRGVIEENDIPCFVIACKPDEALVTPGPGSSPIVVPLSKVYDDPINDGIANIFRGKQKLRDKQVKEKPDKNCLGFAEQRLWEVQYDGKEIIGWSTPFRSDAPLIVSFTRKEKKDGD